MKGYKTYNKQYRQYERKGLITEKKNYKKNDDWKLSLQQNQIKRESHNKRLEIKISDHEGNNSKDSYKQASQTES